jgi:hypothetical protein
VVAINNAKLSEKQKSQQLAHYLKEVMEKALADQRLDSLQVDLNGASEVLDNIRNSETYLKAIAAA